MRVGERADAHDDLGQRADVGPRALEQRERAQLARSSSSASSRASGASRTATSPSTSAVPPPAPQATTGPKRSSASTPTSISTPGVRHPLDEEALGGRSGAGEALRDVLGGAPHGRRAGQPEPHRAGLRLVHDAGRDALQRDLPAQLRRGLARRGRRADAPLLDERDAVGGEQRLRPRRAAASRRRARARRTRIAAAASASMPSSRGGSYGGVARKRA